MKKRVIISCSIAVMLILILVLAVIGYGIYVRNANNILYEDGDYTKIIILHTGKEPSDEEISEIYEKYLEEKSIEQINEYLSQKGIEVTVEINGVEVVISGETTLLSDEEKKRIKEHLLKVNSEFIFIEK